ncbi:DNA-directed RNA polymerase subunit beta [Striga asiatica]|uniref:DNA-directed RNA polymerase subunit beta n=1 Tax=Striga asiatica TaxID=4170 RepID=A0A5A7R096_STRAF|nr:DNA-directed RNA polymerase subunit beta [Striga asiatica]
MLLTGRRKGVAGEVEDALHEAAILAENLEREAAALEVIEDPGMVAADVHPAAERGQVDVDGRFLGVAAEDDGNIDFGVAGYVATCSQLCFSNRNMGDKEML